MKICILIIVAIPTCFIVNCAAPYVLYQPVSTLTYAEPRDPQNVEIYSKGFAPNKQYDVIGIILISTSDPWRTRLFSPEECYKNMQKEAAKRGGDAVINVEYVSTSEDVKTFEAYGSGSAFGAYGFSGKQIVGAYIGTVVRWRK
jgi:hypothetical protein